MARHRRAYKYCLYTTIQTPTNHHPNSMRSFDEFGLENCKLVSYCRIPMPKQKATRKERRWIYYIENDKNGLNNCIAGRT